MAEQHERPLACLGIVNVEAVGLDRSMRDLDHLRSFFAMPLNKRKGDLTQVMDDWRDALGLLSVALAILAAIIYIAQTLRGEVRPHPLSWFLFGILSLTGYLVQRDEGARQGSWTLMAMTVICFLFVAASVARGERSFSRREWAFAVAGGAVFVVYLFTRQSNVAAALTTLVDALGYGPTFVRGWSQPKKDSVASFALNGVKFVPSLMAMDPISFATSFYPATLLVLNAAVAIMLVMRRRALDGRS
jgi:hypothetical protein